MEIPGATILRQAILFTIRLLPFVPISHVSRRFGKTQMAMLLNATTATIRIVVACVVPALAMVVSKDHYIATELCINRKDVDLPENSNNIVCFFIRQGACNLCAENL